VNFESITYQDLDEIRDLRPDGWPDIVPAFEFYINSSFCKALKVREGNKIAGIGSLISFENTSWIGHMIVHKNFRNRGIGFQILKELMNNLHATSLETCLLIASDLGKPVYLKAGFRDVTEYCFMQREKPWIARSFNQNVVSFQEEHRSEIYALDRIVSGENRERLLVDYLMNSKVYYKNGIVEGYYLPDLKEGLIVADSEDAGLALMEVKYSNADKAALPSDNEIGKKFLEENGFVKRDKKGTRMIYGKEIKWEPKKIYSRIGGNLG
jgi:GNAT superfamily N-acetyltransferase